MFFVMFIIGSVFSGCSMNIPMEPVDYSLYEDGFRLLTGLEILDYDQVRLFPAKRVSVSDSFIQAVYLGQGTEAGFTAWDSARVTYSIDHDNQIRPHFQITHVFERPNSPTPDISVRYRFKDGAFFDFDTTVALYTYPYSSAEVFFPYKRIFRDADHNWIGSRVQDFILFDNCDNCMYVHPFGPLGIGKFDFTTSQFSVQINYGAGNFFTADSGYLFFELGAYNLYRYDPSSGTAASLWDSLGQGALQQIFSLSQFEEIYWIDGMTTWQHRLYVNLQGDHENNVPNHMLIFTYDGALVETLPFPRDVYDITIYHGYLFANGLSSDTIYKMDLSTFEVLATATAPAEYIEGFDIHKGYFYYTDSMHYMIGRIPLSALFDD